LIASALAPGVSTIRNIVLSEDITATVTCLEAIGAKIAIEGEKAVVTGINNIPKKALLDCRESGSTLRFMIPVCAALGIETTFIGRAKLPSRPIDTYKRELSKYGIDFRFETDLNLPLTISGKLAPGNTPMVFEVEGDISSQYITGLLLALPISGGEIHVTTPLESAGYVDITADVLANYGVKVNGRRNIFTAEGGYKPNDYTVENDWSQAAFWYAAKTVTVEGMKNNSKQSDVLCVDIFKQFDGGTTDTVDVSQIPDLLPILAVYAVTTDKAITFTNAKRLAIKESNRLKSTAEMINALGGNAEYSSDSLTVRGMGTLTGGTVKRYDDHRIVMAAAIAATNSTGDDFISDPWAVKKSYPNFWDEYKRLSGDFSFAE
jgi:3-phosphoshikimate 1-carboxyvinyltransferase